jgi:uncharacterized protein Yka (UPF0111/DUF47 family)
VEVAHVTKGRWFLPENADLPAMLRTQAAITVEGIDALVAWTNGDQLAANAVRGCEHRADTAKRELWRALRDAFSPPMDAEDLFALSADLDEVLNGAKNLVREIEVTGMAPDATMHDMATAVAQSVRHLADAIAGLGGPGDPTAAADAAIHSQRHIERVYRAALTGGLTTDGPDLMMRRDAYREFLQIGDRLHRVADRIWYATVKEG